MSVLVKLHDSFEDDGLGLVIVLGAQSLKCIFSHTLIICERLFWVDPEWKPGNNSIDVFVNFQRIIDIYLLSFFFDADFFKEVSCFEILATSAFWTSVLDI